MNKTKLFLALFSLLGPVTVTQVKAMPAPVEPANEQSIRSMIQKIEADLKELGQLPSLKAEATQLLADIQQSTAVVLGAPGTNKVLRNKSFSDHLVNIENRFKHPKETANQIQRTISEVAAQIESHQNAAVKSALSVLLKPIKQKVESLNSPVSEIEGVIAKIKKELKAASGQKEHPNGFKPNKHPDGIIIPDSHPSGIIIPDKLALDDLPNHDNTIPADIVTAISSTWTTAKTAIGDKKLLSKQFPQVTDANVADFAKAYNDQITLFDTLKKLLSGQFKAQYTAKNTNEVATAWVKAAAQKLYEFIVTLRTDLLAVEKAKTDLAKAKPLTLQVVPAELDTLDNILGQLGSTNDDIANEITFLGTKVTKNNAKTTVPAITQKINEAKNALTIKDAGIKTAFDTISAKAATEKSTAKTNLSTFETDYKNAIPTLIKTSAGINNELPKVTGNSGIKKNAGKDVMDALNNAVKDFKALTTFEIFKPGAMQKGRKGSKPTYENSKYETLKARLK